MELTNNGKDRKMRKQPVDLSTLVYGKVPPQAKDLEEAILGAMMLEPAAVDIVVSILPAEAFYVDSHQRVYRSILELSRKDQPVDILTVIEQLRKNEELEMVGGPYGITKLTNSVVSSAHIEAHSRIVLQKFISREIIRISGQLLQEAYEDSVDSRELLDRAEEQILSIGAKNIQGEMISMDRVMAKAIAKVEANRLSDHSITGVPTGFPTLDRATRGWQPGLIIVAARPSVGKSAFALKLADTASKNNIRSVPVAMWCLEMDDVQNAFRLLSANSQVILHRIQTGRLDADHVQALYQTAQDLSGRKIFIDDSSGLTIVSLRAKARRLKKKHNIGLIIIDYLQLMSGSGEKVSREQEIARISRGLKMLSRELGIPIIALSQLSREIEKRSGRARVPQLSDLRESGAIEQDADVVVFLWAPEEEEIEQDRELLNRRYAKIAKQRDGVLVKIDIDFKTEIQYMEEAEELPESQQELPMGGNWVKVPPDNHGPTLFIQSGSRFNPRDEGEEAPF